MFSNIEVISRRQRIFFIFQGIFQFLLAVFVTSTVWIIAVNRDWNQFHTWHIFLGTIGFAFFMAEAVAIFNPGNTFVLGFGRLSRGFLHGVLMLFATIAVIAATSLKIQEKINNNQSHFTSTHGITGLVAFLLTMLSFLFGLLTTFSKLTYKIGIKPIWLKNLHNFLGISAYVLGSVSLGYGLRQYFSDASYITNTAFIVIMALCACINLLCPIADFLKL